MPRCPQCLSAVAPGDPACSQCGAAIGPQRRVGLRPGLLVTVLAVVGVGGYAVWALSRAEPAHSTGPSGAAVEDPAVETEATSGPAPTAADPADPPAPRPPAHWVLFAPEEETDVPALAIDADGHTALLVDLDHLPRRGALTFEGAALSLQVAQVDPRNTYALLFGATPPAVVAPVQIGASAAMQPGATLTPLRADGTRLAPVRVVDRRPDGTLTLERSVAADVVLLDADDIGRARGSGGPSARTFDAVLPWLRQRVGRPLELAQADLREAEPDALIEEADALLRSASASESDVRHAIDRAARAAALGRDRDVIEAAQDRERRARHRLVRLQSHTDRSAAIASAREALAVFPDHHEIAVDLARLLASEGQGLAAIAAFEGVLRAAPGRAAAATDAFVTALGRAAHRDRSAGKAAAAVTYLDRARLAIPGRADLILQLAEALADAGDPATALARAREAASLDPALAPRVAEFDVGSTSSGEVVIPFDPRTNAINTTISVNGVGTRFVVDTGASLTTLPTAVANQLGLLKPDSPTVRVTTASGEVEGRVVVVPWVEIGTIRLSRVRAVVIDLPGHLAGGGLLGMNVLSRVEFEMDGSRGRLTLRARNRSRRQRRHRTTRRCQDRPGTRTEDPNRTPDATG